MIRFKEAGPGGKAVVTKPAQPVRAATAAEHVDAPAGTEPARKSFGKSKPKGGPKTGPLSKAGRAARKGPAKG